MGIDIHNTMPRRRTRSRKSTAVVRRSRKRHGGMRGRGWKSFLKSANSFLKRTKLISKAGKLGDDFGIPYVGKIGKAAGIFGYGKKKRMVRRRRRGRGVNTAGGALHLAGRGRKKRTACPRGIAY